MTIGAMAFANLGETSNTSLRAHTAALATATQAIFGLAMNFAIPYMGNPDEGNLKGKVGFIFGGLGALATVWAWFFIPELKGRTFDEIDRMFTDRVPPLLYAVNPVLLEPSTPYADQFLDFRDRFVFWHQDTKA
ncbi:hypothetical protein E4T43_03609 [Aureobasidium subglaciale]|nr:hypothetical protein E4T43_03609 [Aureobasidium subglaciale]